MTKMKNIEPEKLGEDMAKETINTVEELLAGLNLSDEDQIKFWLGFNSGIQAVE